MSICVIVKVPDGLVLAADSASAVRAVPVAKGSDSAPPGVLKVFFSATKVFQILKLPIGVLTWGANSFRARTVASLVEEFEDKIAREGIGQEDVDIKKITDEFWSFMSKKSEQLLPDVPKDGRPRTGFVICGYPSSDSFPEEYATVVPTRSPELLRPPVDGQPIFGASWYGESDAIVRFHHGRDERLFALLKNELNIDEPKLHQLMGKMEQELQYQVVFAAMPLGDAIDYAEFLVQTTINRFRFVIGTELCGGAIDIATITRREGFQWVRNKQKEFYSEG